jgi:hypothetical protein
MTEVFFSHYFFGQGGLARLGSLTDGILRFRYATKWSSELEQKINY